MGTVVDEKFADAVRSIIQAEAPRTSRSRSRTSRSRSRSRSRSSRRHHVDDILQSDQITVLGVKWSRPAAKRTVHILFVSTLVVIIITVIVVLYYKKSSSDVSKRTEEESSKRASLQTQFEEYRNRAVYEVKKMKDYIIALEREKQYLLQRLEGSGENIQQMQVSGPDPRQMMSEQQASSMRSYDEEDNDGSTKI